MGKFAKFFSNLLHNRTQCLLEITLVLNRESDLRNDLVNKSIKLTAGLVYGKLTLRIAEGC